MSFQNKSFWMPRDAECLTDGDVNYDASSRVEPKCAHQWFMDAFEPELFCYKKQAVEVDGSRPMSGTSNANISMWQNNSSFQSVSGQFTGRLFGSETSRAFNLVDRSIPAVGMGNLNLEINGFEDQFGSNSSVGLSMRHTIEHPSSCLSYDGIRKVKVNQVRDSDNDKPISMGSCYSRGDNNSSSIRAGYNKIDNNITVPSTCNGGNENTISMGPTYNKADDNFISIGQTFGKGDGGFMLMGQNYDNGDANVVAMSQPFDKRNGGFIQMGHQYEKGNGPTTSEGPIYNKEPENYIPICSAYDKTNQVFISIGPSYGKGDDNILSMGPVSNKAGTSVVSRSAITYDNGNSSILSMGLNYKGGSSTISFGGFADEADTNPYGGIISDYGLFTSQASSLTSNALGMDDSVEHNSGFVASGAPAVTSTINATPKIKEPKLPPKNVPPNNFPSNVKSLLSTGMFDGVPVKYVSWSREKNLKGIIKGTGYLCGCNDCEFSKALNAYELERHAGCKTKHPNNHIYFENGKTVYAVAQELKSTPQEMLFEVIQNVTGSPLNQTNFRIWKASFQAATRELQRIYGKDEVIMPS